jgi:hypothetical protein
MRGVVLISCALALLCCSLGEAFGSAGPSQPSPAGPPCAGLTTRTLVAADGMVAERIYRQELVGPGTVSDLHQVESYAPLLSALDEHNKTAVHEAVVALVFSHTHIVRLRVSQGATLLADVGGPYIIAPAGGKLYYHGHLVGSYLLSVQDDLGFVGLETRLVGAPVILHVNGARVPIKGTVRVGKVPIPRRGVVVLHKRSFDAYSFDARAYPSGTLRISVMRPVVHVSTRSCAAVRVTEIGRIVRAIWQRFQLDASPVSGFVTFAQSHTGALTYVRRGAQQIAASAAPGPPSLPASGTLRYHGVRYAVSSFAASTATGPVRVYALVPL